MEVRRRGGRMDSSELLSGSGSLVDKLGRAWETFRVGFEGVLFSMEHERSTPRSVIVLEVVIDTCQMISLLLPRRESVYFGPISMTWTPFATVFAYTQFDFLLREFVGVLPVLIFALALVIFELLNMVFFAIAWTQNEVRSLWSVKLLRSSTHLLVTVLYIPILSTFFADSFACEEIGPAGCYMMATLTILVSIVFIAFSLAVSLALFDMSPTGGRTAMPHARFTSLHLAVQTIWVLSTSIIGEGSENELSLGSKLVWIFVTLVPACVLAYCFVWYQPYYDRTTCTIRGIASCLNAFTAFSAGALILIHHGDTEETTTSTDVGLLLFGGYILLFPSAVSLLYKRRIQVAQMDLKKCSNGFEVELKGRYYLQGLGDMNCQKPSKEISQERLQTVKEWYKTAMEMFPKSPNVCIFYAEVLLAFDPSSHAIHVRNILAQAQRREPGIEFGFSIFKARRMLEQDSLKNSDIVSVISREKFEREADQGDKDSCLGLYDLWSELEKPKPSSQVIMVLAEHINKSARKAAVAYSKLLQLAPHDNHLLRRYGSFLIEVANNPRYGASLIQKAEQAERYNARHGIASDSDLDNITSENCGVVVIGTLEREKNIVLSCNASAARMLKCSQRALMGVSFSDFVVCDPATTVDLVDLLETSPPETCINKVFENVFLRTTSVDGETAIKVHLKLRPFTPDGADCNVIISFVPAPFLQLTEPMFMLSSKPHSKTQSKKTSQHESQSLETDRLLLAETTAVATVQQASIASAETLLACSVTLHDCIRRFHLDHQIQHGEPLNDPRAILSHIAHLIEPSESPSSRFSIKSFQHEYLGTSVVEWQLQDLSAGEKAQELMETASNEAAGSSVGDVEDLEEGGEFVSENGEDAEVQSSNAEEQDDTVSEMLYSPSFDAYSTTSGTMGGRARRRVRGKASSIGSASIGETWDQLKEKIRVAGSKSHPTVKSAGEWYLFALLATILLLGAEILFQNEYIRRFQVDLQSTANASKVPLSASLIAIQTHSLLLNQTGFQVALAGSTVNVTARIREEMVFQADLMRSLQLYIYDSRGSFSDELLGRYDDLNAINFYSLQGMQIIQTNLSLLEGSLKVSGLARLLGTENSKHPTDMQNEQDAQGFMLRAWTLLRNTLGTQSVVDLLMDTSALHAEFGEGRIVELLPISEKMSYCILLITILMLARSIQPLFRVGKANEIDQSRLEVMDVLFSIPKNALQEVKTRYRYRLETEHEFFVAGLEEEANNATSPSVTQSGQQRASNTENSTTLLRHSNNPTRDQHKKDYSSDNGPLSSKVAPMCTVDNMKPKLERQVTRTKLTAGVKFLVCCLPQRVIQVKAVLWKKRSLIRRTYAIVGLCITYWILSYNYGMTSLEPVLTSASYDINDFLMLAAYQALAYASLRVFVATNDPDVNFPGDFVQNERIKYFLDQSEHTFDVIINGDPERGSLGIFKRKTQYQSPQVRDMFLEDACIDHPSNEECASIMDSVLSGGLHTGLMEISNLLRDVYHFSTMGGPSHLQEWLEVAKDGENFLVSYLIPQLSRLVDFQTKFLLDLINSTKVFRNQVFACFVAACFLCYLVVVRPVFQKLDKEVQQSRNLLLLLPLDIVEDTTIKRKISKLSFINSKIQH